MANNKPSNQSWCQNALKNLCSRTLSVSNCVPKHIGFVMDGNRRYAKRENIEVKEGHEAGFVSMSQILEVSYEAGVKAVTVFAFSIENFKRSSYEVDALMTLAKERIRQLANHGELAEKYGVKVNVIGDLSLLDDSLMRDINYTMKITERNSRCVLNVCLPYTGRHEILSAMKSTIASGIPSDEIDENYIESNLFTAGQPPLDLLIRTSGVSRLSDFMLWQVSRKDVVIELVDCLWPELGPIRMTWILLKYTFNKYFFDNRDLEEFEDECYCLQDHKKSL